MSYLYIILRDEIKLKRFIMSIEVTFYAYPAKTVVNGVSSTAGHAFVSIKDLGTFGFYPSQHGKPVTSSGGQLNLDDQLIPFAQSSATFCIDENTRGEISALINNMRLDPPAYLVGLKDCVSFIYRIVDLINAGGTNRIVYKSTTVIPINAVDELAKCCMQP